MAEHRGIHQIFGILTQPLFTTTTTRYAARKNSKPNKPVTQTFDLHGVLDVRGEKFSIDGEEFLVSPDTWVVGQPKHGSLAKVKGTYEDGVPTATCLVIS